MKNYTSTNRFLYFTEDTNLFGMKLHELVKFMRSSMPQTS